jgi:hypothetical protein
MDLSLAFDLPAAEYTLGPLRLRPYSLAAHRRAERMSLVTAMVGLATAREHLAPPLFRRELEALHWLVTAPLEGVRMAFLTGGPAAAWTAVEAHAMPRGAAPMFAEHLGMILELCQAAMFDTEERELPGGESADSPEPPPTLVAPSLHAALVTSLCDRLGISEEHASEWLPFPRVLQYSHAIQWANPYVWTVKKGAAAPDPHGEVIVPDEGYGEAVAF